MTQPGFYPRQVAGERALLAAEAALTSGKRKAMADALTKLQRVGQLLPRGHRPSHGQPSWRQRFKDAAQALADKMAAS